MQSRKSEAREEFLKYYNANFVLAINREFRNAFHIVALISFPIYSDSKFKNALKMRAKFHLANCILRFLREGTITGRESAAKDSQYWYCVQKNMLIFVKSTTRHYSFKSFRKFSIIQPFVCIVIWYIFIINHGNTNI